MKLNGKVVDLHALRDEMELAGIPLPALGTVGDDLVTYDADGHIIEIPDIIVAQAVLAAHVPPPPPKSDIELLDEALDKAATADEALALVKAWIKGRASGGTALADAIAAQSAKIQPVVIK